MGTRKKTEKKPISVFELPADQYDLALELTILGEPGRKSNSRRIVRNKRTGKQLIIKSEKAMRYEEAFMRQVPGEAKQQLGSPTEPLALWAHIHYASNRPDLSLELILDLLQKAEVVSNDRYVKIQVAFGEVDPENPRALLRLYRLK